MNWNKLIYVIFNLILYSLYFILYTNISNISKDFFNLSIIYKHNIKICISNLLNAF